ncbi:MAG: hypothetical protein V4591_11305, partial [Bdellovibrionota bacterium]
MSGTSLKPNNFIAKTKSRLSSRLVQWQKNKIEQNYKNELKSFLSKINENNAGNLTKFLMGDLSLENFLKAHSDFSNISVNALVQDSTSCFGVNQYVVTEVAHFFKAALRSPYFSISIF